MAGLKKVVDISGSVGDNNVMFSETRQNVREINRVGRAPAALRDALNPLLLGVLIIPAHDGVGAHI